MAVGEDGVNWAATLRPTRAQFERPFCDYIREQFQAHPDWAMFKVIPPKPWKPYKRFPNLEQIRIETPIKQHVFGKSGAYMCILEEQRGMSAAEFKRMAENPNKQAPEKGHRGDDLLERAFWSSATTNPPLYGADTPVSLFDKKVPYGWNFHDLGCLFKEYDVPEIAGVTTPMTYFGMWKSFFGWHKEDVDLYSINYLHAGAPKVWYGVSPRDNPKFDAMTRSLFPDNAAACPAFMRHKDILISPKVLRTYGVPVMQAKQEAGEFIVLNAAAYHAGFNLGFNCAEAVNFALPEWLEVGRDCVNCDCAALDDGVRLDMGIFFPELRHSSDEEEEEDSEEESDEEEEGSEEDSRESDEEGEQAASSSEEAADTSDEEWQDGGRRGTAKQQRGGRRGRAQPAAAARVRSRKRARAAGASSEDEEDEEARGGKRRRASAAATPAVRTPKVPEVSKRARPQDTPRGAVHGLWGKVAEERPIALVERDDESRELRYCLAHRLDRPAKPGCVWVGALALGPDGLFRPTGQVRCTQLGSQFPRIAHVRSEWVQTAGKRKAGWKLLTKPERILM